MVTLSKPPAAITPSLWLVTASPTYTSLAMARLSAVPMFVQVVPLLEWAAVKSLPERDSRIQPGTALLAVLARVLVVPPAAVRAWRRNLLVAVGETRVATFFDPAVRFSRIMTAALVQTLAFCNEATRAVMVVLPAIFR